MIRSNKVSKQTTNNNNKAQSYFWVFYLYLSTMKYIFIILLSLVSFSGIASVSKDTSKVLLSKLKIDSDEIFLSTLTQCILSRDLSDLNTYFSSPVTFVITKANDGEDMIKYVSPESAIYSLEYMLDELPPSTVQVYKNPQPDGTIFTLKFVLNSGDGEIRVIFFLHRGEVVKVILQ